MNAYITPLPWSKLSESDAHTVASAKQLNWYSIYTKSRFEKKLCSNLQKAHYQVFLPMVKESRVWSDRIKTVLVPLLPSYVFVKIHSDKIPELYPFSGFVRMVCFEHKPSVIREEDICLLKQIETHGFVSQKSNVCKFGDWVRVIRGPLRGQKGRIEATRSQSRIVFQIESIRQSLCVDISMADVEKI